MKLQNLLLSGLLTLFFSTSNAQASDLAVFADAEGFCVSLPALDNLALTERMISAREALRERQNQIRQKVDDQGFSILDTAITIAVPGGLLYAAILRNRQQGRKSALSKISNDIHELSGDILSFQSAAISLKIASLK